MKKQLAVALGIGLTTIITGCANHIEKKTLVESHIDRATASQSIDIDITGKKRPGVWDVKAMSHTTDEVVTRETSTVYDISTPYQAAREIYELPVGIISLAGGIVVNVADLALLGLLPNNLTHGALNVAFAGMNPFMNIESSSRTDKSLLSTENRVLDTKIERVTLPLSTITAEAGGVSKEIALNKNGKTIIDLLDLNINDPISVNYVTVSASEGEATGEKTVRVSTADAHRIERALHVLSKYTATPEQFDSNGTAKDIFMLSKLGFDDLAHKIEASLKASLSDQEFTEFRAASRDLFLTNSL